MSTLNSIFYGAAVFAIIALPFLLVNFVKYMQARQHNALGAIRAPGQFPVKSALAFVIPGLIVVVTANIMTTVSRGKVLEYIRALPANYAVFVNHQPARQPDRIISALQSIAPQLGHHSHPTTRILVDIESEKGSLTLELGRDSANPHEYWVFEPEHDVTANNEIGRLTATVFDEY